MPIINTNGPDIYMVNYKRDFPLVGTYVEQDDPDAGASGKMSKYLGELLKAPPGGTRYTDVIILNHGFWKDIPAASDDFVSWINGWWPCRPAGLLDSDFNPLVVATHWPSNPLGDGTADQLTANAVSASASAPSDQQTIAQLVPNQAAQPALVQALGLVLPFARTAQSGTAMPDDLVAAINAALAEAQAGDGLASAPMAPVAKGTSWGDFQDQVWKLAMNWTGIGAYILAFLIGFVFPVGSLVFSYYASSAQTFGQQAVLPLAQSLAAALPAAPPRFHVMGHSLGTGVVSEMLLANQQAGKGPEFGLILLAQGAIPSWSYANNIPFASIDGSRVPGQFSTVPADAKVAGGPLLATYSSRDQMVGTLYFIVATAKGWYGSGQDDPNESSYDYRGLGNEGFSGEVTNGAGASTEAIVVGPDAVTLPSTYGAGQVYSLDGKTYISGHSDICGPQVGGAFWAGLAAAVAGS
ncbi:hypothetical protein [Magnetospirillum sp. LM-5]|uniref:hypothetical protein n=1 Tax=Magnetospirillum sp. LM-5 TaxID=2681466 RepID=UPI0015707039|nr:hypothetical protein [Magnetospirillum sp. LM-5]